MTRINPLLTSLHDLIRIHALPRSAFDDLVAALRAAQAAQEEERAAHARAIATAQSANDVLRAERDDLATELLETQAERGQLEAQASAQSLKSEISTDNSRREDMVPLVEYLDAAGGNSPAQRQILDVCTQLTIRLLDKNRRYGNSALEPVRLFSKASPVEQILVRLDDKISRLSRGVGLLDTSDGEDVIEDLIGYLVLLKIAMQPMKEANHV